MNKFKLVLFSVGLGASTMFSASGDVLITEK